MNSHTKKSRWFNYQGVTIRKGQNFLWQRILIIVLFLIFLIIFLNLFQLPIRNAFYFISSPISDLSLKAGNSIYSFFSPFFGFSQLKKENNSLKKENQELLLEISLLKEASRDNQLLKESFEFSKERNLNMLLTQIVGIDVQNDFVLIDKGLDDGISENMPVVSSRKVVYGKVFKAYKNFSQVMLISAKNTVTNVKIQNEDKTQSPIYGAIKGKGNLLIYLDLVDSNLKIEDGNTLITSGLDGFFPRDLLVGKVISINRNDLKPFQTAQVQPFFEIKNTDNLFVITNYIKN